MKERSILVTLSPQHSAMEEIQSNYNSKDEEDNVSRAKQVYPCTIFAVMSMWANLVLTAIYQRGVKWDMPRMIGYVKSLFTGYDVQSFTFNIREDSKTYVIDGKQRLTTIKWFMENAVPYIRNGVKLWYSKVPKGQSGEILGRKLKIDFSQIQLLITQYKYITLQQEIKVFHLLNYSLKFTPGESLKSVSNFEPFNFYIATFSLDFEEEAEKSIPQLTEQAEAFYAFYIRMIYTFAKNKIVKFNTKSFTNFIEKFNNDVTIFQKTKHAIFLYVQVLQLVDITQFSIFDVNFHCYLLGKYRTKFSKQKLSTIAKLLLLLHKEVDMKSLKNIMDSGTQAVMKRVEEKYFDDDIVQILNTLVDQQFACTKCLEPLKTIAFGKSSILCPECAK